MSLLDGSLKDRKILVVGDVMLDRYWFGDSSRISPEAPVPVVKMDKVDERLGGAGNVALNIANLGVETALLAVAGNDEAGCTIQSLLKKGNIDPVLELDRSTTTTVKLRIIARNQQMLRCDFESIPREESLLKHLDSYLKEVHSSNGVVFSDYAKGGLSHVALMIAKATQLGIPVFVDPKGRDFSKYANATVITPNKKELSEVIGSWDSENQLIDRAQNLRESLGVKYLLLTRSEEGMTLFGEDGCLTIPTRAREVYDVSGAGDTVIAALSVAYCGGYSMEEAAIFANNAAGVVVGKIGTVAITIEDIKNFAS